LSLARRLPIVVSLDATPLNLDSVGAGYDHRPDGSGPLSRLKLGWYRSLFRRAAALTTWNQWARDSLVRDYQVDASKITVIPPVVELPPWRPIQPRETTGRPARLLFVGGNFKRKGGHVLLDAFRDVLSGRCELDVVTDGEVPGAAGLVRVHRGLTPDDPRLRRLFDEADVFVLPTLSDCMPVAIIEAMASGLPVVATDVGAIREEVEHGETGLLVPPGDAGALALAVRSLLDDPDRRRAFGVGGRRRAERLFDGGRNYRSLVDLLKRCADGSARRGPATSRPGNSRELSVL
jgi:glycosyltransferase involved in cell wall biosynthesis